MTSKEKKSIEGKKNNKISMIKEISVKKIGCDCCGREYDSSNGRYMISGNFVCNECGLKCNPSDKECFVTKRKRKFKF